mgnify:CR=1 FL=1
MSDSAVVIVPAHIGHLFVCGWQLVKSRKNEQGGKAAVCSAQWNQWTVKENEAAAATVNCSCFAVVLVTLLMTFILTVNWLVCSEICVLSLSCNYSNCNFVRQPKNSCFLVLAIQSARVVAKTAVPLYIWKYGLRETVPWDTAGAFDLVVSVTARAPADRLTIGDTNRNGSTHAAPEVIMVMTVAIITWPLSRICPITYEY